MIKIYIQGLKDGLYDIDLSEPVGKINGMYPEFYGDVKITGTLRVLGNKFTIEAEAECNAKLICDRSLTEYTQLIEAEIISYNVADDILYAQRDEDDDTINIIHEDEKYIDISREVSEELAVNLPLKRINPEYADKEIEEIFPNLSKEKAENENSENKEVDERWAPLKNFKIK